MKKILTGISVFVFLLAICLLAGIDTVTVEAAGSVVIDLAVGTGNIVRDAGGQSVTIKGVSNGSRAVKLTNVYLVEIENDAVFRSDIDSTLSIQNPRASSSVTIRGHGPNITIAHEGIHDSIYTNCDLAIEGTIGEITSTGETIINSDGELRISGRVDYLRLNSIISHESYAIFASDDVSISGEVGYISVKGGEYGGAIYCDGDTTISGKVGAITDNHRYGTAVDSDGDILISKTGSIGNITGTHGLWAWGNVTIDGSAGNFSNFGNNGTLEIGACVFSVTGDININGTTGALAAAFSAIESQYGNVIISGTTGDITTDAINGYGGGSAIWAGLGSVTVSGTTGDIYGEGYGIEALRTVIISGQTDAISGIHTEEGNVSISGNTGDIDNERSNVPDIDAAGTIFLRVKTLEDVPTETTVGTHSTLTGKAVTQNIAYISREIISHNDISWSILDAGGTGATISDNTLNTLAAGTVKVRATIKDGISNIDPLQDYTQDFLINVKAAPLPVITTQPLDQTVDEGQTATFSVSTAGDPAPTFQWQVSNDHANTWSDIAGATDATLTIANTTAVMSGNEYRVDVTNTAGTVTSLAAKLLVRDTTTDNIIVLSSPIGRPGDEVDVDVSYAGNPGIAGAVLDFEYDPAALTPVSVTKNPLLDSTSFTENLAFEGTNKIRVMWVNADDVTTEHLFTIRFKINDSATAGEFTFSDSATAGETPIAVTVDEMADASFTLIDAATQNGSVTVTPIPTNEPGADITTAAAEADKTHNSITVEAAFAAANPGAQSIEYLINTDGTDRTLGNPSAWQSGLTFSGLSPDTTYYVWARTAAKAGYDVGTPKVSAPITTDVTPNEPGADITTAAAEADKTHNSITVEAAFAAANPGAQSIEYLINTDGTNRTLGNPSAWQSGLTFSGLSPDTTYYVWARTAAKTGYDAGTPMVSLPITTDGTPVTHGDANGDSNVDEYDLLNILQYIVRLRDSPEIDLSKADVYQDGSVGLLDAILLAQYLADPANVTLPMKP